MNIVRGLQKYQCDLPRPITYRHGIRFPQEDYSSTNIVPSDVSSSFVFGHEQREYQGKSREQRESRR